MSVQRTDLYRHNVILDEHVEYFRIDTESTGTGCQQELLLLALHGYGESRQSVHPRREEYAFYGEDFLRSLALDILRDLERCPLSSWPALTQWQVTQDFSSTRPWTTHRIVRAGTPLGPLDVGLVLVVEHGENWELMTNAENPYAFHGSREKFLALAQDIRRALSSDEDEKSE